MKDEVLQPGERIVARADASCRTAFTPLGPGEVILTNRRLLWFSSPSVLNVPFNLWHPSVEVDLTHIEDVSAYGFLPNSPLRVRCQEGLYGFAFRGSSLLNPLRVWKSRKASQAFLRELRGQLEEPKA